MYRQLFLKIIFLFFPCTLVGHELWIDTSEFKVEKMKLSKEKKSDKKTGTKKENIVKKTINKK